jgi:hypothetical protein
LQAEGHVGFPKQGYVVEVPALGRLLRLGAQVLHRGKARIGREKGGVPCVHPLYTPPCTGRADRVRYLRMRRRRRIFQKILPSLKIFQKIFRGGKILPEEF